MSESRSQPYAGLQALQNRSSTPGATPRIQPQPQATHIAKPEEEQALGLVGDGEPVAGNESKIKAMGGGASVRKDQYRRTPYKDGKGACRIRSFHGRLSQQGLEYMDNQINEWLDANPDVEVKFVTSNVGVFEGKMREPALVLNMWY